MRRRPWDHPLHVLVGRGLLAFFALWEATAIITGLVPTISSTVWALRNNVGVLPVLAILLAVTAWLWHHFLREGPRRVR